MPTDDRQQALDQEHPLDAAQPEDAVELQQTAGQRVAKNAGERDAHIEVAAGPAQVPGGDPVGEEEDDAGEEAGLGDTQQEAQDVEAGRPLHEHEGGGDDAPGHHDPGQPPARPDLVQQQVARDLEDGIAHEEEAGAEGVRGRADAEVGLELLLGEGDIAAVQERDDVHQQQEWDQSLEDLLGSPAHSARSDAGRFDSVTVSAIGVSLLVVRCGVSWSGAQRSTVRQCMCLPPSIWMVAPLM